eukprot:symbB.v1.2.022296.t1/scaffold1969.1/size94314/10
MESVPLQPLVRQRTRTVRLRIGTRYEPPRTCRKDVGAGLTLPLVAGIATTSRAKQKLSRRVQRAQRVQLYAGPSAQEYDVIVIGAGLGGLACAAALGKAGRKVLVVEAHSVCGGCAPW